MNKVLRLIKGGGADAWQPPRPSGSMTPTSTTRVLLSEASDAWHDAVLSRLEDLVRLPSGWNSYGGLPVSFANAHFALSMLESTCRAATEAPQVVPGSGGDLQVEWHTVHGDIELHVLAPNRVLASCERTSDGSFEELELTNDFTQVAKWVREIAELPIAVRATAA